MKGHSQVVLLGTGTPNADPDRSGPAVAVIVNGTPYLVDFGPGIVRRAAAACRQGIEGLDVRKLNRAFVTHLHSDHTAGYPDLILTPWVLGRREPLEVYGPAGLQTMTEHILAAYQADIRERLEGLEPANDQGYKVNAKEVDAGWVYEDRNVRVEAFEAQHGSWPTHGYKFYTPDRVIAISGDTAPRAGLAEVYRGCDVVIHEVYSWVGLAGREKKWREYHSSVHTSSRELAEIASQAKPGILVLYHQLFNGVSEEDLLQEVKEGYEGKVVSGRDLAVY
ncbi:MAG: MBL fold metallo-hydrolase [Anaerolineales bacterium]|nr:MBL fold metallo-hydrolase [Anaerolineales bacterium]